ncbi:glutamate ABC transporter substrate-binding protein [Mumia sp. zg.B17]|uniref:glutamate ABC transporter substrate-binding protein n=1 Tax=Mumia sp. zg.B17 TaxID=2855446 RepID=UPI001C6F452D|nr:glutamate ABC transporter substrate-binding protein [Mumia sp. zg.B17]MBW9205421.1 glutamate ABC transporter substrate-binding protein [Mumia sp. zg.B17]
MKIRRTKFAVIAAAAALALAGCGDAGNDDSDSGDGGGFSPEVVKDASFDAGSRTQEIADAGTVKIGVKFDQPGIGFKSATSDTPVGFDPNMGKILAAKLGIPADKIEWVETISDNREPFLQNSTVDFVIASYSITDERRQVVGQAGPYYVTGQQLLVAADDDSIKGPDDLSGKKVCSVTGSTSIKTVEEEFGATPAGFDTYSECVEQLKTGSVDAVTTDGAILAGYAAEDPDKLKVVGEPFSEERYGIGYNKDAAGMCDFINSTLEGAFEDGEWEDAFDDTLGKGGIDLPEKPTLDPCP